MRITVDEKFRITRTSVVPFHARRENWMPNLPLEQDSIDWSRVPDRTNDWNRKDDVNVWENEVDRRTDDHVTFLTLEYSR